MSYLVQFETCFFGELITSYLIVSWGAEGRGSISIFFPLVFYLFKGVSDSLKLQCRSDLSFILQAVTSVFHLLSLGTS